MFNKDFAKDPMAMSKWELIWFGTKFLVFTYIHYIILTLAGAAGAFWMFSWSWQNLGW